MKKNKFRIAAIILLGIIVNGCEKGGDYPVMILNGPSTVYVSLDSSYTDLSASAKDANNGAYCAVNTNLSRTNPNVKRTGVYTITYWAYDGSGDKGSITRTVIVRNDADFLANTYIVADTADGVPYVYSQTITSDTSINREIHFSNFGNYNNCGTIYGNVTANKDSIILKSQTATNIGLIPENHQFSGTAIVDGQNFVLNYTDKNLTQGTTSTGVAHYTKQ